MHFLPSQSATNHFPYADCHQVHMEVHMQGQGLLQIAPIPSQAELQQHPFGPIPYQSQGNDPAGDCRRSQENWQYFLLCHG